MPMASIRTRTRSDGTASHQVIFRRNGRGSPQEFATFEDYATAEWFKGQVEAHGAETALEILDVRESRAEVTTVQEWCLSYVEDRTGITEGTRRKYRSYAENHLGKLAPLPLASLTPKAIAAWVNTQLAEGSSGKTVANKHGFLYAAMDGAVRAGRINANPCAETKLTDTANENERTFLTRDEFAVLLNHVRPDSRDLVTEMIGTGHRFGESTALQVRDWDSSNRRITISRGWKYSGESGRPVLGPPKTKRAKRTHTVSEIVADIYDRAAMDKKPTDFLFLNSTGNPWTASAFHSSVWQPAVECANGGDWQAKRAKWEPSRAAKAGGRRKPWLTPAEHPIGKRPRVHDLRHTAASWLLQAGVPIVAVSRRLGHESIKTTVDTYGHLSPEQDAAMDAVMEIALSSAHPQIED